ncbi:MAG: NAD(P)/FAD-dependent oxidoreductase [Desulfovibrio sp.]|nr:NAD(P)/FAD-dependent oxidoreductase [Desulfovibrio sp.]
MTVNGASMGGADFDLIVLGGGPAGSNAALHAAGIGMKTALVEPGFLGGTCLNAGCVPTKYLLGASACLPLLRAQRRYKVAQGETPFDFAALQARKERYIRGARKALQKKLEQAGVTLFKGRGVFSGPQLVTIRGSSLETKLTFFKCLVAIGSIPASFPDLKPDGATVCSPASILNLLDVPKSLIIVGAGAIGLELGELLHRFGCNIDLTEASSRLLPREDPEVGAALYSHYARQGWNIHRGRRIRSVKTVDGRSVLTFADGETLTAETSLLCIGRRPATAALTPEAAGLAVKDAGWLDSDAYLRCSEHVYAVGDINGRMLIANAAEHQARYAVEHAAGATRDPYRCDAVPSCIYGGMEFMRVGPTAKELLGEGERVFLSKAPLAASPVAQSSGCIRGFVKMLWTNDSLRSVYAVGHDVSHLLTAASLLVSGQMKKNVPLPLIRAYPALDEVLESAIAAPLQSVEDDAC